MRNRICALLLALLLPARSLASLEFPNDGTSSQINVLTGTVSHNIGTGDFTFSAWAVRLSDIGQSYQGIMTNDDFSPAMYVEVGGSNIWGGYWNGDMQANTTLTIGQWYHLVMRRSGTTVSFWVNGVQEANTYTKTDSMSNATIRLAASSAAQWNHANCRLDDVRLYRRALSAGEIESLGRSRSRILITDGLVGWWRLDDGNDGAAVSGAVVLDRSGNGNTGTANNSPVYRDSTEINYP